MRLDALCPKRVPLAISYLPEEEKETVGERITFLASDSVGITETFASSFLAADET